MGLIREGERLDDLQCGCLRVLQRPGGFCFGMDTVLLAAFAARYAGAGGRAIDLGTGSGVLPLLLVSRAPSLDFDAVEIQPEAAERAVRSVALNGLEGRIRVHAMDWRNAPCALGYERFRLAVSNPPYGQVGGAIQSPDAARRAARHEGGGGIEGLCRAAGALLQNGGRFCVVYPAGRLLDLCDALRAAHIAPKHIRFIHAKVGKPPNLLLLMGVKAGKPLLHYLPPLYIRDASGHETPELQRIYRGGVMDGL